MFRFVTRKLNLKTPGREDDEESSVVALDPSVEEQP